MNFQNFLVEIPYIHVVIIDFGVHYEHYSFRLVNSNILYKIRRFYIIPISIIKKWNRTSIFYIILQKIHKRNTRDYHIGFLLITFWVDFELFDIVFMSRVVGDEGSLLSSTSSVPFNTHIDINLWSLILCRKMISWLIIYQEMIINHLNIFLISLLKWIIYVYIAHLTTTWCKNAQITARDKSFGLFN